MSMHNNAASAYVVEARKFLRFFVGEDYLEIVRMFDEGNVEELKDFLGAASSGLWSGDNSHWPKHLPELEDVFILGPDDESDGLERDTIYFQFDESSLFEKTPTATMKNLMNANVAPQFERWTIFG